MLQNFQKIAFLAYFCLTVHGSAIPSREGGNFQTVVTDEILTKCGETLVSINGTVKIEYKVGVAYSANERCAWTIRFNQAQFVSFELEQEGFVALNDKVTIATLQKDNYNELTTIVSQDLVEVGKEVKLPGTVAVIVFASDKANEGTGFVLTVRADGYDDSPVSSNSIYRVESGDGNLAHPDSDSSYSDYELSTFILAPSKHVSGCLYPCMELHYTQREWNESSCNDRVDVFDYLMENHSGNGWMHEKQFCEKDLSASIKTTSLTLVAFSSDLSVVGKGFELRYQYTSK